MFPYYWVAAALVCLLSASVCKRRVKRQRGLFSNEVDPSDMQPISGMMFRRPPPALRRAFDEANRALQQPSTLIKTIRL